jgi:hypothetical protein
MEDYYCPKCHSKLEMYTGCGSVGYFCHTCKVLISRSKMLTEQQMKEEAAKQPLPDHDDIN